MKIAILGCGKQAEKHIKSYQKLGITDLVLNDIDVTRAKDLANRYHCEVALDTESIYSDQTVVAIDICTPVTVHYEQLKKTIHSRKHFFCEKPLTNSFEHDKEIRDLANAHQVIGMVGYIYRFAPAMLKAKEIIESNVLGSIYSAFFRLGGRGSHQAWKHQRATGGGAINEMSVHLIDLAAWLFGQIDDIDLIEAKTLLPMRQINGQNVMADTEDYVLYKVKMDSHLDVTCLADFITPAFSQYIEVQGTNGSLSASIIPDHKNQVYLLEPKGEWTSGYHSLTLTNHDFMTSQIQSFVQSIKAESIPQSANLDDNLVTAHALMKLKQAYDKQLALTNVLDNEEITL